MRGNRDFLLDVALSAPRPEPGGARDAASGVAAPASFTARCAATMLADPCPIAMFGTPALLAHGDALCTDDSDYQAFRALARSDEWQRDFLRRPLAERIASARELRERSESEKAAKAGYLMDVNASAVERAMRAAGARLLIHGHTHRPARHRLAIDGEDCERWVLPDWDARAGRGGMLVATAAGLLPVDYAV